MFSLSCFRARTGSRHFVARIPAVLSYSQSNVEQNKISVTAQNVSITNFLWPDL